MWLLEGPLVVLVAAFMSASEGTSSSSSFSSCVNHFCLPSNYSKLEPPPGLTKVSLSLHVLDVLSVSESDFTVSIYAYLMTSWVETRMSHRSEGGRPNRTELDIGIDVDKKFLDSLWHPELMVAHIKSWEKGNRFSDQGVLKISKPLNMETREGFRISKFESAILTFLCPMRFNWYPMDTHECYLHFGLNRDRTKVELTDTKLRYNPDDSNVVLDYLVSMRSLSGSENRGVLLSGRTYSTSGVFIALSRRAFGYIHSYYIPSGLLVIVSWTSFLIPPEIVAGRMAMLVTLFLCLINMFLSTIKEIPASTFLTALNFWMIACLHFVFWALMGYAYLLFRIRPSILWNKRNRRKKPKHQHPPPSHYQLRTHPHGDSADSADMDADRRHHATTSASAAAEALSPHHVDEEQQPLPPPPPAADAPAQTRPGPFPLPRSRHRTLVDDVCLAAFPFAFACYNVVYWSVCLVGSDASRGARGPWVGSSGGDFGM